VEQISSIRDLRTDKVTANSPEWHFTGIVCGGRSYEVKETEEQILEKIGIAPPKKQMDKEHLLQETIVLLAADLYRTLYDRDECGGWGDVCADIIGYARQFEQELDWQEDDERDYMVELEKFEQKVMKELNIIE
jgi:hypothetical protein